MNSKLEYSHDSLAALGSIKVIVSKYVEDFTIVFRAPKTSNRPSTFVSFYTSIWDLKTGKVHGDLDPSKATEMHMSAKRYDQLKTMIDSQQHDYEMETLP